MYIHLFCPLFLFLRFGLKWEITPPSLWGKKKAPSLEQPLDASLMMCKAVGSDLNPPLEISCCQSCLVDLQSRYNDRLCLIRAKEFGGCGSGMRITCEAPREPRRRWAEASTCLNKWAYYISQFPVVHKNRIKYLLSTWFNRRKEGRNGIGMKVWLWWGGGPLGVTQN